MKIKIIPLRWREHHVKGNGWYGLAYDDEEIVYVYQPADMRQTRAKSYWRIYSYWRPGRGQDLRPPDSREPLRFRSAHLAKLAAQKYWRDSIRALIKK